MAERWGKPLQIEHSCDPTGGAGGAEQHIVHCAFGDVPFIVLGAKGVGRTSEEAESNCAWNLMSFFQEYLSRPAMIQIRKKWASADSEIDEAVKVCRRIEDALNSEQFCQLKTVAILDVNPPEKAWARQLRWELRKSFAKQNLLAAAPSSTSVAAKSTIFTQQAQSGTGLKRKLSTDPVTEGDLKGSPPMKQSKACQVKPTRNGCVEQNADEYDEDGLHFTYISPLSDSSASSSSSVVCLDTDDGDEEEEDDEIMVRDARPTSDQPSLNIASSGASRPVSSLRATPHDPLLSGEASASFYERNLIGVNFNTAARTIPGRVYAYRDKYPSEFATFTAEIWRHYEDNIQTEEIYSWKMEALEILLKEFRPAFPHQHIKLYAVGSTVNGCGSHNSDMDLCLCVPTEAVYSSERVAALKTLRKLNTIIKGKPSLRKWVRTSEVIPAKVPIIKMRMHPPYQDLDIDININNIAGIYNSHLIHYYAKIDGRFPAVCLLVKHWAITNGIGDASGGSFNSYSLILLVLHYFQCGVQPAVLPNLQYLFPERFGDTTPLEHLALFGDMDRLPQRPENKQSVGELLVGFFYYYAEFDFVNMAISLRNACVLPRSQVPLDTFMYRVFIEEPFDRNNTARCVTKDYVMARIQKAFCSARDAFSKHPPLLERINVMV